MAIRLIETRTNNSNVPLRLAMGHFATNHSHLNYYIDLTMTSTVCPRPKRLPPSCATISAP